MPRPGATTDPETGRPTLPVRAPLLVDLDTTARAMALQHGVPSRKIGKDHVRDAVLKLVELRFHLHYEPDVLPDVLDAWRRRLVEMETFPADALKS